MILILLIYSRIICETTSRIVGIMSAISTSTSSSLTPVILAGSLTITVTMSILYITLVPHALIILRGYASFVIEVGLKQAFVRWFTVLTLSVPCETLHSCTSRLTKCIILVPHFSVRASHTRNESCVWINFIYRISMFPFRTRWYLHTFHNFGIRSVKSFITIC